MTSPVHAPPRRIYHPVQQDYVTFVETAEETGRSLVEIEVAPGGQNKLHRHLTYAEHFEVLEGELVVTLGRTEHRLGPGDTAVAAAGAWHCFSNPTSETTRFMVELRPGHRGMELALQIGYGLAGDGQSRADGTPKSLLVGALLMEWAEIR